MVKNKNKNRIFKFNRVIRKKTDYKQRLELLKSGLLRLVIRKSNRAVLVQLIEYKDNKDFVLSSNKSTILKKYGYKFSTSNLVASYLTGFLVGTNFLKSNKKHKEAIVDLGLQRIFYGGKLFAATKGVIDSGLKVRINEKVFPSEERLSGKHLKIENCQKIIEEVKKSIQSNK